MTHKERLNKMSVKALKKEISAHNKLLKGYSKMKKADIIDLIIKNKSLFPHLFSEVKKEVAKIEKKVAKTKVRKGVRKKDGKKFSVVKPTGGSDFDNAMAQHASSKKKRRKRMKKKRNPKLAPPTGKVSMI